MTHIFSSILAINTSLEYLLFFIIFILIISIILLYQNMNNKSIGKPNNSVNNNELLQKLNIALSDKKYIFWKYNIQDELFIFDKEKEEDNDTFSSIISMRNFNDISKLLEFAEKDEFEKTYQLLISKEIEQATMEFKIGSVDNLNDASHWYKMTRTIVENNSNTKPLFLHGYIEDITDAKTISISMYENEMKFKKIFEYSKSGICFIQDGIIIDSNFQMNHILKCTKMQILGKNIIDFSEKEQTCCNDIKELDLLLMNVDSNSPLQLEWNFHTYANTSVNTEISFNKISLNDKEIIVAEIRDVTEKRNAQQKLLQSEIRHRTFFENLIPGSLYCQSIFDEEGNIVDYIYLDANKSYLNQYGTKKEDVVGKTLTERYPSHSDNVLYNLNKLLDNSDIHSKEFFFEPTNSYLFLSAFPINKSKKYFFIIELDVSDRHKIVNALRESEKKYNMIMDNTYDRILLQFTDERKDVFNNAYFETAGYSWEDINIHNKQIEIYSEDVEIVKQAQKNVLEQGNVNYTYRILHKNGSILYQSAETVIIKNKKEETIATLSISHNITEIIKYQKELEFIQNKLKTYNQSLESKVEERTIEIIQKNIDLKMAFDNLKQTQSLLVESEKLAALGKIISGVAHDINSPLGSINSSIDNTEILLRKYLDNFPNFYLSLSPDFRLLFNQLFDNISVSFESLSTIDKRKIRNRLAKEIEQYGIEASNDIAKVLINLNLYNNYDKFLPLLQSEIGEDIFIMADDIANQFKSSQIIKLAVTRASSIVAAMKNYIFSTKGNEKTHYNIQEGIDIVLIIFNSSIDKYITIIKKYDDIPTIYCNATEMNQVWTNLIENSLQAMDEQGTLEISITTELDNICVRIKDNGMGIPKDVLPQIFEPFYTTKKVGQGTGIGLDISKRFIENCNGTIEVESEENIGTTFIIKVPIN